MTKTCPVRDCAGCSLVGTTPGALRGRALVLRALAAFAGPLALAVAGALLLRHTPAAQVAGALAGGTLGAWLAALLLRKDRRQKNGCGL